MKYLTVLPLVLALPGLPWAQADSPEPLEFPPALQRVLKLTPYQIQKIQQTNMELAKFMRAELPTQRRLQKAQKEALSVDNLQGNFAVIAQSTINLQTHRRKLQSRKNATQRRLREILTPEQNRALEGLRRAAAMYPAYQQAHKLNLLNPPGQAPKPEQPAR